MNQARKRRVEQLLMFGGLCMFVLQAGCSATNRQAPQTFQPQQFQSRTFQAPQNFMQQGQPQNGFMSQFQNQPQPYQGQMVQAGAQQFAQPQQAGTQYFAQPQQAVTNWGQQQQVNYPAYPAQYGTQVQATKPGSLLPSFSGDGIRNMFNASQLSGQFGPRSPSLPNPLSSFGNSGVRC